LRRILRAHGLSLKGPSEFRAYRKVFGYALPALVGALLVSPVLWFTNTLLATWTSFAELGKYSVAYGLANYLLFIPTAIGIPLVPIVSRLDRFKPHEFPPFLVRTMRIGAFLLIPPTILLVGFPGAFLELRYGGGFAAAAPIVRVLAPAVLLAALSGIVGYGIAGTGRMWEGLLLNLAWAVVLVTMSLVLVPSESARGLAFAFFAAYLVHFGTVLAYIRRTWSVRLGDLLAPLAIAATSVGLVMLVSSFLPEPWRTPAAIGLILGTVGVEYRSMSRREIEVLSEPIRMLILWIGRSP
jgi:O-antigen/teichoic acid export membrane protein